MNANELTQHASGVIVAATANLHTASPRHDPSSGAPFNDYRYDLDAPGFFELEVVLEIVPIGRSKWYEGQKLGVYPKAVPLGVGRRRAYRRSDIKALVLRLESGQG